MAEIVSTPLGTDTSLKAYYRAETGALTTDSKGTYTLTNTGTVADATGKFGGGANFNGAGSNQVLGTGNNIGYGGGNWSIVGWYNPNSAIGLQDFRRFLFRVDDATSFTGIWVDYQYNLGTPRILFERSREYVADDQVFATVTLGVGTWYHLGVTYNGTSVIGYLNGTAQGTVSSIGNGNTIGATDCLIGNAGLTGPYQADGIIDDVGFFSRVLSVAEIGTLFNPAVAAANASYRSLLGVGI